MPLTIKQIEEGLRATGGFISQTAKKLNVTQGAISKRISENKYLQEIRKEIDESYLDLAESKLLILMKDGNLGALCFYLKCKGKKRGYVERQELTGKDGEPIETKSTMEAGPGVSKVLQALGTATSRRSDNSDEGGDKK